MNTGRQAMKKFLLSVGMILASALLIAACETTTTRETASGAKPTLSDSELETKIKNGINTDSMIREANLSVKADADDNQVTLSGTVPTEALRVRAVSLAKEAHPGIILTDRIVVKPAELTRADYTEEKAREARDAAKSAGEKIGSSLDDAWIHTKIVSKLIGNSTTPERKINVDVVDNVVTLRGAVQTAEQKAEAERVAKDTEGVKRVVNRLKVDSTA
jgi:hyperosmotically inducible periplasmic protein